MAFEEHTKRKPQYANPYADYEYVNKNSRKTGPGLVIALLFGIGLFVMAWWRWTEIAAAEQAGGEFSLSTIEWGLYQAGGKWAVSGVLILLGAFFFFAGIRNYLRLEKIRRS